MPTSLRSTPQVATQANILARMLQSLGAELSVRWLLFLGMFLVVVSSGVLAASQWEKFPPAAQYGVLLAYTLSFWGVSFWAGKQPNLLLTAQTLLIVTLLLVPVNFWAMDSFRLWQNPWEWIVVAAASVALTAITVLVCNNQRFVSNKVIRKLSVINILALSYLHWGWKIPGFPLIAIYLAMAGTTIATISTAEEHRRTRLDLTLPSAVIIYALAVLLVRGIFVVHLDVQELGLAIGVCGWLMAWLAQPQLKAGGDEGATSSSSSSSLVSHIGGILLFLGWVVSVSKAFPWQATCVSGLSLWFFRRRLQRYNVWTDVGAIFVIGLQTIWLVWRLVPFQIQEWAIATGTHLTNSQHTPCALSSVALFPYVIFMVMLTNQLYRTQKVKLADFGEKLTLVFGILLTLVSLVNPTLRSLNLLFSTITLATVSHQRSTRMSLVYLTQITGVLTLCSIIDRALPHLGQEMWASILLAVAVAEWLLSLNNGFWQRSGWYLGFGLAALSYSLLWKNAETSWFGSGYGNENWGVVWLITPVALTYLASLEFKRITCAWLSVTSLGLSQLLTLPLPGARLIGLAIATALMLGNTYYLQQIQSAVITVGFALGFVAALLWEGVPGLPHLSPSGWFLVGAISIISLWLLRKLLLWQGGETRRVAPIYAIAIDRWAIALCSLELLMLSVQCLLVYQGSGVYHIQGHYLYSSHMKTAITSSAIVLGAIVYRSWQQPTNWGFYGIGWCLELLIAELLGGGDRSIIKVAIANIALGLTTQLLGEWWYRRNPLERLPNRWHILPLIYSVFGVVLRGHIFANWTGLSTLAVAFIAMGVGRRLPEFKILVYLGLVGVSIGAYELLLYQLLQTPGGVFGDRLIAMCVLGTGIMYAYRVLAPWLVDYLHLSTAELRVVAHIHWAVSSCLLLVGCFTPISLKTVGLGTGVFLIRYAIFQGRQDRKLSEIHSTAFNGVAESRYEFTSRKGAKAQRERVLKYPIFSFHTSIQQRPFNKRDVREISTSEFWVYLGLLEVACLRGCLKSWQLRKKSSQGISCKYVHTAPLRAMSKVYPSNLTQEQWELLEPLIPAAKPGGRKREADIWEVLNAIFYVLCEGCRWRSLPGDFPNWQTVYTYFRNWRKDGTWVRIHDRLREWVRVDHDREPSPSEAIIDSQSVKSAAMVSQAVGYDAGKQVKGRKRFLTVDTLGLVLRVLITAASVGERQGGKEVLLKVKQMGPTVSRLHTIWVDAGFDGNPFMQWVMDFCRWIVQVVLRPKECKKFVLLPKRWVVERTFGWLTWCRRLNKDYELLPETAETFVYLAMIRIMLRQLA